MKIEFNKIKNVHILVIIIVIIIGYGIYNNPDRKIDKTRSELESLFASSFSIVQEMTTSMYQNKNCFSLESLEDLNSENCIIVIENAQNNFKKLNAESLKNFQDFYDSKKDDLDDETKKIIENALTLYKSESYINLLSAYDKFFTSAVDLHKALAKGVDNMTSSEKAKFKSIAENFDIQASDLRSATISYNEYLNKNFDADFVKMINEAGQSIKESANQ